MDLINFVLRSFEPLLVAPLSNGVVKDLVNQRERFESECIKLYKE